MAGNKTVAVVTLVLVAGMVTAEYAIAHHMIPGLEKAAADDAAPTAAEVAAPVVAEAQ